MAAYEEKGYLTSIDKNGNKTVLFPATKIECVDGLEEALESAAQTGSGIYVGEEEPADAPDDTLWLDTDEDSSQASDKLVLKSPDGTEWNITVSNNGTLAVTRVSNA